MDDFEKELEEKRKEAYEKLVASIGEEKTKEFYEKMNAALNAVADLESLAEE